jgi:uncharacterized protein YjiK
MRISIALLLAFLPAASGCRPETGSAMSPKDSALVASREARLAQALAAPDTGGSTHAAIAKWNLGQDLLEISGLALKPDGRLFAHADENGTVFELEYRSGRFIKAFSIGKDAPVVEDFEGITSVGDTLFMLTSKGVLYQFLEGEKGTEVPYVSHDTGLEKACEFEGVAYDSTRGAMLMACKNVYTEGALRDSLVIYRWGMYARSDSTASRLTVPLEPIISPNGWDDFHPSDITIDPGTGNYVIVAAQERALVVVKPTGELVSARPLGKSLAHAEGVAITQDGILIISTEGRQNLKPAITLFRWP